MIKYIILCIFTINIYANQTIIQQIELKVNEAFTTKQYTKLYQAIRILDSSKERSFDELEYNIRIELIINMLDDGFRPMKADLISICANLQEINKVKQITFPKELVKITNSKSLEKTICTMVDKLTGQQLVNNGLLILNRSKNSYFDKYNINKAMPYFKLAEKLNFDDPELYQVFLNIYGNKGNENWEKVFKYSKKFLATNSIKQMPEATVRRLYAISKFLLISNVTKSDIKEGIENLKKAKELGDKKSIKLIADLNSLLKNLDSNKDFKYLCLGLHTNSDCYKIKNEDLKNLCIGQTNMMNCSWIKDNDYNKICQARKYNFEFVNIKNHNLKELAKGWYKTEEHCYKISDNKIKNLCLGKSNKNKCFKIK